MYCSKCGANIPEGLKYCPHCEDYKNTITSPMNKAVLVINIIALVISLIVINEVVLGIGIVLSIVALVMVIILLKSKKNYRLLKLNMIFAITALLSNSLWLIALLTKML